MTDKAKVVELCTQRPNPDVVAIAQTILDDAKSGRVQGLGYIVQLDNFKYASGFEGSWSNNFEVLGNLSRLQHSFNKAMDRVADVKEVP